VRISGISGHPFRRHSEALSGKHIGTCGHLVKLVSCPDEAEYAVFQKRDREVIKITKIIKSVFLVMIIFYFIFWWFSPYAAFLFPGDGGIVASYAKPIYWGIVLLSGLIMGCTVYLSELIKESNSTE